MAEKKKVEKTAVVIDADGIREIDITEGEEEEKLWGNLKLFGSES